MHRSQLMQSLNPSALKIKRHSPPIQSWTKLMKLVNNGVQFMKIALNQGAPKTPLPIILKGSQNIYVHLKEILP